jgi:hypothetical protein
MCRCGKGWPEKSLPMSIALRETTWRLRSRFYLALIIQLLFRTDLFTLVLPSSPNNYLCETGTRKKIHGPYVLRIGHQRQRHVFSGSGSSSRLQPACSASYRWLPLPYFDPPCSRLSHPSVVGPCTARCPVINRNIDDVV